MRLLECPWLQQQHKSSVEACIRTLAMVGKEPCCGDALLPPATRMQLPRAISAPAEPSPLPQPWQGALERLLAGIREVWLWDVLFGL